MNFINKIVIGSGIASIMSLGYVGIASASSPTYTCYFYRSVYTYSATKQQAEAYQDSSIYFSCQKNEHVKKAPALNQKQFKD